MEGNYTTSHNLDICASEVLEFLISSNMDSINDILLTLVIHNVNKRNLLIEGSNNLLSFMDNENGVLADDRLAQHMQETDLVDQYYKYILTDECILDSRKNLIPTNIARTDSYQRVLDRLKKKLSTLGFEWKIVNTMTSEEYNLVYSNIANKFPQLTDAEISDKILEWGNLKTTHHFVKTKEPGANLSLKLTGQSEFSKNEIFFIKTVSEILGRSKETSLYSMEDVNLTKVDTLNRIDDIFLIGLYKLYCNMQLVSIDTSYRDFVNQLRKEELQLGLLKRYDYMIDEIQTAYNMSYDEYKENEIQPQDPNGKTYVEEVQRLTQHEIKKLLDQLIQQKWIVLYPNASLKAGLKLQDEMDVPTDHKCFRCPNYLTAAQGIQCHSCRAGNICLPCSKDYFKVSESTLNQKDKTLTDGKWCPTCFEPWRLPEDMIFHL